MLLGGSRRLWCSWGLFGILNPLAPPVGARLCPSQAASHNQVDRFRGPPGSGCQEANFFGRPGRWKNE